jgi:hypothetical protein
MAIRKKTSTTRLPQNLQQELVDAASASASTSANARKRRAEEEPSQRKIMKFRGSSRRTATVAKVAKRLKPPSKEDQEDAYIAYLESKLGMDKGGKKKGKQAAEGDGLDGMLQYSSIPYFDLEKSYWLRSHGLGGFVWR